MLASIEVHKEAATRSFIEREDKPTATGVRPGGESEWYGKDHAIAAVLLDFGSSEVDAASTRYSVAPESLDLFVELGPPETLRRWIQMCPGPFVRDMAYGLLESAIYTYTNRDLKALAQAVVSWGATLQIEADRPLARRLHRQLREAQRGGS